MVDRYPTIEIRKSLWSFGLSLPSVEDLVDLEAEVIEAASPKLRSYLCNFKIPKTKNKIPLLHELVSALGIGSYFDANYDFDKLLRILQVSEIKGSLEALLISTIPEDEVAALIAYKWKVPLLSDDLQKYRAMLWDIKGMQHDDWSYHLAMCDRKGSLLKRFALENPYDHAKLRWLCDLPADLNGMLVLDKLISDAYFLHLKNVESFMPNPAVVNSLSGAVVRLMDRVTKLGGNRTKDSALVSLETLESNRAKGASPKPALIHRGTLPPIETHRKLVALSDPNKKAN